MHGQQNVKTNVKADCIPKYLTIKSSLDAEYLNNCLVLYEL